MGPKIIETSLISQDVETPPAMAALLNRIGCMEAFEILMKLKAPVAAIVSTNTLFEPNPIIRLKIGNHIHDTGHGP